MRRTPHWLKRKSFHVHRSPSTPSCAPSVRPSSPLRWRRGVTILELLTAVGVMGMLAAIVLPAVNSSREAARRTQCFHQLRQVGLALQSYHDSHQALPAGVTWDAAHGSVQGWGSRILPYLELGNLHVSIDSSLPVSHQQHSDVRRTQVAMFVCPSDIVTETFTLHAETAVEGVAGPPLIDLPTANYMGVFGTSEPDDGIPMPSGEGAFIDSRPVCFAHLLRGLSNTVIVGERTMSRVPSTWFGVDMQGEDAACRLLGNNATVPNCESCDECEFNSRHPGGVGFLWADGHVELIADGIESDEYRRLSLRTDY